MCGICGVFDNIDGSSVITAMNNIQRHRGPDDEGYLFVNTQSGLWETVGGIETHPKLGDQFKKSINPENFNLALGSRRLAILDLSPAGHMPMSYWDGDLWITHNGEVYNYLEIRTELENKGYQFQSNTDSEVILAAYIQWGTECLHHFNGMFAFAIWDARRKRLFCARDRFGVKPFYFHHKNEFFVFASEIKAILQHPKILRIPNDRAIFDYLVLGVSDHNEETFFQDIFNLSPGHFLIYDVIDENLSIHRWWQADINPGINFPTKEEELRTYDHFTNLLEDAVRIRLRSDVPVGTALSGGLDSSAVVCLANNLLLDEQVIPTYLVGDHQKTFTARFKEAEIDEYLFSHKVIDKTGAEEHVVYPSGDRLWKEIEKFIWHMDEPVNSTSQYSQWNVMRLAKQNGVTVLLDGQGGDEILAGYYYYFPYFVSQLQQQRGYLPAIQASIELSQVGGKPVITTLLDHLSHQFPWRIQSIYQKIRPAWYIPGSGGTGLQAWQLSDAFLQRNWERRWQAPTSVDDNGLVGILYRDLTETNLPKLLRYEDRNSMAFSLETRLPFLDYRLVEWVFSLPLNYRINKGWSKWILRKSLEHILPREICWRRSKLGFPTPEERWLAQGTDYIRELFANCDRGFLNSFLKQGIIDQIVNMADNELASAPGLWRLINLIIWNELFINNESK